jgi:hypothetical protein
VTLTLHGWRLDLPARPPRPEDAELAPLGPAEAAPEPEMVDLADEHPGPRTASDPDPVVTELSFSSGFDAAGDPVLTRYSAIGLDAGHGFEVRFRLREGDAIAAETEMRQRRLLRRGGWSVRIDTLAHLEQDADGLRLRGRLEAWEGDERVCRREWDARLPRG